MGQRQAEDPLKVIFNYNNVFYSFFYDDTSGCTHRSREFAMNYVYSGEMVVDNGHERILVGKGECVFIPRDHHITLYKRPLDGEKYCGIFLNFTRNFLREMFPLVGHGQLPPDAPKLAARTINEKYIALVRTVFAYALRNGFIDVNPCDG